MAHRAITLTKAPSALSEALQFTLSLQPIGTGQQIAQREIISALQNAMDARRHIRQRRAPRGNAASARTNLVLPSLRQSG